MSSGALMIRTADRKRTLANLHGYKTPPSETEVWFNQVWKCRDLREKIFSVYHGNKNPDLFNLGRPINRHTEKTWAKALVDFFPANLLPIPGEKPAHFAIACKAMPYNPEDSKPIPVTVTLDLNEGVDEEAEFINTMQADEPINPRLSLQTYPKKFMGLPLSVPYYPYSSWYVNPIVIPLTRTWLSVEPYIQVAFRTLDCPFNNEARDPTNSPRFIYLMIVTHSLSHLKIKPQIFGKEEVEPVIYYEAKRVGVPRPGWYPSDTSTPLVISTRVPERPLIPSIIINPSVTTLNSSMPYTKLKVI